MSATVSVPEATATTAITGATITEAMVAILATKIAAKTTIRAELEVRVPTPAWPSSPGAGAKVSFCVICSVDGTWILSGMIFLISFLL